MASGGKSNTNDSDNLCVVCFKDVIIYSIGVCDHPVCFECSTRMRILCKQNECPICRRDLPKVVFTKTLETYSTLYPQFERSNLQNRKFGIIFCTLDIQKAYFKLLEHRCYICLQNEKKPWAFENFQQLKDHMRREHELFYCDLCCDHLKIFSFERRCYTRQELAYHRRKGDKNNTSHRGHPLCEFCDTRFVDNDELFRHMRRNHLFCHLCDADGKHQYYVSMDDLKRHFRDEHFLCEEGECKTMLLTAVFRTDIDLKAHIATDHGRFMSKSATRQARTLELEFTMAPRPRTDNNRGRRPTDRRDRLEDDSSYSVEPGGPGGGSGSQTQMFVNPLTSDQFPALGGSSSTNSNITLVSKNYTKFSNAAFNSNDFPSLGGSSSNRAAPAVTIRTNSAGASAPEVTITRTVRNQPSANKPKESFPALGGKPPGGSTVRLSVNSSNQQQTPKVSIQVNQAPSGAITTHITTSAPSTSHRTLNTEVFPALSKGKQVIDVEQPQWVQTRSKKTENKTESRTQKVVPCPTLETSDLNSFPSLSKGKNEKPKKTSSVNVPVDSWVNLNSIKGNKKKNEAHRTEGVGERVAENSKANAVSGSTKKPESNKKSNQKSTAPSGPQTCGSSLDSRLASLKLVDANRPDVKSQTEDNNKKSKKKKTKNMPDTNGNSGDSESKEVQQKNQEKEGARKESEARASSKGNKDVNHNEESNKNGLISKKRTELKIGALSNNTADDDFPALGSTKPPPGFTGVSQSPSVKPPPGFNSSEFPSLGVSNDLTFTNSSGQSYAIIPTKVPSSYKQPHNFQSRNQNLIRRIMDVLNDNESIRQFKTLSDNFRKGEVDAKNYVQNCDKVLANKFDDIFPELLVLLPDVQKQQELYQQMSGKGKESLMVCENCKQVILKKELSEHYNYHQLENHFPSLGSAQQISNSAWKK